MQLSPGAVDYDLAGATNEKGTMASSQRFNWSTSTLMPQNLQTLPRSHGAGAELHPHHPVPSKKSALTLFRMSILLRSSIPLA